jgi:hypothetical protein
VKKTTASLIDGTATNNKLHSLMYSYFDSTIETFLAKTGLSKLAHPLDRIQ